MIGDIVFGQPPLATLPKKPYVQRGWIKQCKSKNDWSKQGKNSLDTLPCGYSAASEQRDR